tara:strand:- start:2654 stop:4717 length:2064 start_codon:yes stop_codon:yes gene_type:complete
MAIPRFARAFIKGAATAGVGMMAQQAKEDREDTVTDRNEKFELLKIEDRAKANRVTQLELLTLRDENAAKALKRAEEKVISDTRDTLSSVGWENNTLDYLESINVLNNGTASFKVWANQFEQYYNPKGEQPEWHLKQIKKADGETISFQDHFLNQVNESKKTNVEVSKKNVDATLENVNGIPTNVVKSQTGDITGATTTTDNVVTSTDDNVVTSTDDFTPTIDSATSGSGTVTSDWRSVFKTQSPVLAEQLLLTIDDMSNEKALALVPTFDPNIIIDAKGTKGLKLKLESNNQYSWTIIDVKEDIYADLAKSDKRDKALTAALLTQPGMFPTKTPIYMGNGELNPSFFQNLDPTNALKYTTIKGNMIDINNYLIANNINLSAGEVARKAVNMYKSFDVTKTSNSFDIIQLTGYEGDKKNYETVKQTGLIIRDDLKKLFNAIDLPIATTAEESEQRNIVINKALSNYRSQLLNAVTKDMDKNTDAGKAEIQETKLRYGSLFDNMINSFAQGNSEMNYWDDIPEGRTIEGTFEKDLFPDESAGGTSSTFAPETDSLNIEPSVMAGSEPETQEELDSMDKILATQPIFSLEDKNNKIIKEKETLTSDEKSEVEFIGGEGEGNQPWLFSNGNFNPDWENVDTLEGSQFTQGTEASNYREAKSDYQQKINRIKGTKFFKKVWSILNYSPPKK